MTSVVAAGLTGIDLTVIGALLVSAIGCAAFASRKPKKLNPAQKAAIDGHWETTPSGTRVWRGATFVLPRADEPTPEGESK